MTSSLAEAARNADRKALSELEERSVALLYEDGWSVGELKMTFMADAETIRRSIIRQEAGQ